MAFRFSIGLIAALFGVAPGGAPAATASPPSSTQVDELVITADADVRVVVVVGGDIDETTYVASAPPGLYCGGVRHQYDTRENRQCWLRIKRKTPIILTAQADGRYGVDWSVQWVGCEPIANGAACTLSAAYETQVAALFTRQ